MRAQKKLDSWIRNSRNFKDIVHVILSAPLIAQKLKLNCNWKYIDEFREIWHAGVNGVWQNKGLRPRDFATSSGVPFYYPIRKDYNLWIVEPLHTKQEVKRPTQRDENKVSIVYKLKRKHSIDHSSLIYLKISEVGLRLFEKFWSFKLSQQWSN